MESEARSVTPLNSIPADVLEMLGPPPLLSTEDERLYFAIVAQIARPIPSPDIVTWMLIKDLADHRFEIARYRRLKTRLIQWAAEQERARRRGSLADADRPEQGDAPEADVAAFQVALRGIHGNDARFNEMVSLQSRQNREREAGAREARMREARERDSIANAQPAAEDDFVGVFANWIGEIERIDILARAAEQRFTHALREIERHIFGFGRLLRADLDRLIDGEVVSGSPRHAIAQVHQAGDARALSHGDR